MLNAAIYLERLQAFQSAMHKSLLALVAIIAFWLGVENTYENYDHLRRIEQQIALIDLERPDIAQKSEIIQDSKKRGVTRLPANQSRLNNFEIDSAQKIERLDEARKDLKEEKKDFRKQVLDLSIAGTRILSKPGTAPTIWFISLLCWLIYFFAKRSAAHRALASYVIALSSSDRKFGIAGEGSIWLAPLPDSVCIAGSETSTPCVKRADMLFVLGWTPDTEVVYTRIIIVILTLIASMAVVTLLIVPELCSEYAVENDFCRFRWRIPEKFLTLFLASTCFFYLFVLGLREQSRNSRTSDHPVSRRTVLVGSLSFGVIAFTQLPLPMRSSGLIPARNPRFLDQQKKKKRLENYYTVLRVEKKTTLYYSQRSGRLKESAALHFANSRGEVRLFTKADPTQLHDLSFEDAVAWAKGGNVALGSKVQNLAPSEINTLAWERAALSVLENNIDSNGVDIACQMLFEAGKLTLKNFASPVMTPNWRILDLLAGISVRYHKSDYLDQITAILEGQLRGIAGEGISVEQAKRRLTKWKNTDSRWRRYWSNSPPVWWHDPLETRKFDWSRTRLMLRPPTNPETRQKPIKLA